MVKLSISEYSLCEDCKKHYPWHQVVKYTNVGEQWRCPGCRSLNISRVEIPARKEDGSVNR